MHDQVKAVFESESTGPIPIRNIPKRMVVRTSGTPCVGKGKETVIGATGVGHHDVDGARSHTMLINLVLVLFAYTNRKVRCFWMEYMFDMFRTVDC